MDTSAQTENPLHLTGGWNTTTLVRTSIDWIEVTFPRSVSVPRPDFMARDGVETRPINAYDRAMKYSDGRVELTHSSREEMGTHVICTGSVLSAYQDRAREILDIYITGSGRLSRLDLAVDVFNDTDFTPALATAEIQRGGCKCRARKYPVWHDAVGRGHTQYVGAPASEVRVRIYDKSAERDLDDLVWTRIEGQYRGERAHGAGMAVTAGADEREIIRGYVDFPDWREWQRVFRLPAQRIPTTTRETNTERWLLEQVAPALARTVALSGDSFLDRFVSAYERELVRIRANH